MNKNLLYRRIPKVDVLLEDEKIQELIGQYSYDTVLEVKMRRKGSRRSNSCLDGSGKL